MIGSMIGPSSQCRQPILAIDIGRMIDRGLDDNCGPILACYIAARVKPMIFQIYNDINNDNKI